ncbi:hypothetical protein VPH35_009023 [Triticum aestivum]
MLTKKKSTRRAAHALSEKKPRRASSTSQPLPRSSHHPRRRRRRYPFRPPLALSRTTSSARSFSASRTSRALSARPSPAAPSSAPSALSPPFRRRFRDLHAPPLLALFREPGMSAVAPAASRSSDPAIAGAFADLLRDDDASEWRTYSQIPCSDGFVQFVNRSTERVVSYNPHMLALAIFPEKPHDEPYLEFHTLPPDQEYQSPYRVVVSVTIAHGRARAWPSSHLTP